MNDYRHWCDLCEKCVKGKVHKFSGEGYSLYVCDKHIHFKRIKKFMLLKGGSE